MRPKGRPVRATVDTNLFVSGLIRRGLPVQVLGAWLERVFRLVTSEPIRVEVARVLARPKFQRYGLTAARIAGILEALATAEHATPLTELPVAARDPDDAKFLACALGGQAEYLVSGDGDLLVLNGHPALGTLRIVGVREFLGVIGSDPLLT